MVCHMLQDLKVLRSNLYKDYLFKEIEMMRDLLRFKIHTKLYVDKLMFHIG